MYFVHPQIKFNIKNLINLFFCFFKKPSQKSFQKLQKMFPGKNIYFTDMGRSAFRLIVEEMGLQNSEILIPAYICDIFYPIFKDYNITPRLIDANPKTFNMEPEKIKEKLNSRTKAILVSHTYGLPADIEKIKKIAAEAGSNPIIIEDTAHGLGGKINGKYLGNLGDVSFFSLYKLFPTLRGGMAILSANKKDIHLTRTKFSLRDLISLLNTFKLFSFLFKKFAGKVASKYVRSEKIIEMDSTGSSAEAHSKPSPQVGGINNFSLNMFLNNVDDLDEITKKRKEMGKYYFQELEKLGFKTQPRKNHNFTFISALAPEGVNRDEFVRKARLYHLFLTRIWRKSMILAFNPDIKSEESFPNAKEIAERVINFPLQNFYFKKDIDKIIKKIELTLKDIQNS